MRKTVVYECKYCKCKTTMTIEGLAKKLGIYWLKCSSCKNNWRAPIDLVERLAQ